MKIEVKEENGRRIYRRKPINSAAIIEAVVFIVLVLQITAAILK